MIPRIHGLTPLLQVFDMPRSLAFYRDVLGFAVFQSSNPDPDQADWVMLRRDECTLMLNTAFERDERPPAPDPRYVQAHSDTILYFGCDDADAVYASLQSCGWPAREPINTSYGMTQVYTNDPDGFELCFQHPVRSP